MSDPKGPRVLRLLACATHGDRRWQGHVVCDGCGRVFQTRKIKEARFASETCPCGAALMPPGSEQVGDALGLTVGGEGVIVDAATGTVEAFSTFNSKEWTARPICYLCFRLVTKQHGGTIPNFVEHRARRDGN